MTQAERIFRVKLKTGRVITYPGYQMEHQAVEEDTPTMDAFFAMQLPTTRGTKGNYRVWGRYLAALTQAKLKGQPTKDIGTAEWFYTQICKDAKFMRTVNGIKDNGRTTDRRLARLLDDGSEQTFDGFRRTCVYRYLFENAVTPEEKVKWTTIPSIILDPSTATDKQIQMIYVALHGNHQEDWTQYAKALAAIDLRKEGYTWEQAADQLNCSVSSLKKWVKQLELHQRAEKQSGISDERKFAFFGRFVKDALFQDVLAENKAGYKWNGPIWTWFVEHAMAPNPDAKKVGHFGWTGDMKTAKSLKTIYDHPDLKAEIKEGGDWQYVASRLNTMKAKGELSALERQVKIIRAMMKPTSAQLDEFGTEYPHACLSLNAELGGMAQDALVLLGKLAGRVNVQTMAAGSVMD